MRVIISPQDLVLVASGGKTLEAHFLPFDDDLRLGLEANKWLN